MKTMKRFSALFAILLSLSISIHVGHVQNAVAAEADWMPDANLRTAVREDLGLADNETLTQAKMLELTSLHAPQAGISNLTGLEHATNLTLLVLWQNQISSLTPIQNLTTLTEIRIGGNQIGSVAPLGGLTKLTRLGLQRNNISNISALSSLVNLQWLRLVGNSITDFSPLSSLSNLTDVDVEIPPPPDTESPGVSISVPSGVQTDAFDVSVTFTELVSGFAQSDLSVGGTASASVTSWSANSDNTTYTATVTPTTSGSVTLNINAGVATDAANNSNTAATSQTVTVNVDTESPGVTVSVPSGVQNGAFNVTITFTETVSGFTQSDVSLNGSAASITAWSANSNNTIYTATITPTASGTVTIGVAANVATDAANNQNTAATSKNVTVDVDKPTVTIGVPSGTQTGAFDATITFTEAVSGFTQSDVSLTGSAASITAWSANSDDTVYTATITPTASGTVTIGVAANVATDATNNANTAATSKTVSVDVDRPTTTVGVPSGTQTGAFDATITFLETVSGFVGSDVSLSGSAASITSWRANSNNTVYTATITPTASGTVTIGVAANVATDAAGNNNTAATSKTVTVNIPDPIPDPATWMPDANLRGAVRSALGIASNANFSKDDLSTLTSLRAVQAQVTNLTGLEYATGLTTLVAWGNQISDVTPLQNLTSLTEIRMGGNAISDVTPLDDLTSLTKLGLQNNNISNVTPLAGLVNLTWLRLAGNPISDLSPLVTLVNVTDSDVDLPEPDTTVPGVSISVPSGTQTGAFDATITFTETVSGFVQSEVSLSGSAASITGWSANNNDTVYTATIAPTASGTVTIGVAANVATDGANNQNTAATSKNVTVSVDTTAPGVTVSVPSGTQTGAFDATITFTETVSGFVQSEVSLSGSAASITSWSANSDDTVYTATITPTASGTVTVGVAANVATDAANNQNTAATSKNVTVSVDTTAPGVTVSVPSGVQNGAFSVTITFTETVSGFVQSEVSLTGSTASITSWSANSDDTVYTATITPTASGTVTVAVAANVATDAANNPNTAATAQFVTVQINIEPLTWMPDVNLIRQVLSALGLTDSNDLTQTGMATLTQLTATDANISDLTGLEHAINLTHLNLEGNSITNIVPIKGLDNLINLNLSHNQLGEVSSSNGLWIHHHHWPNLQELDLSHNQIHCRGGYSIFSDHDGGSPRIYADPLPSLTHLDVSYNGGIGDAIIFWGIPIQTSPGINHLQNLTHLDIRYTDINYMFTILYDYSTGWIFTGSHLEWLRVEGTTFSELYKLREIRKRGLALQPYLIDTIDIDVEVPEGPYYSNIPLYPPAPEQEKWMPDPPLRTAIREKLGLSDGEFLTQTKILELTELEVSDQDIYTTEGLEYATNLTSLDLSGTAKFIDRGGWSILKGIYRLPNLETLKLSDPQYTLSSFSPFLPTTKTLAYDSDPCTIGYGIITNIQGRSPRCDLGNERIEHFPSLKHLEIKNWKTVDALWLLHLETLETLKISGAETYYRLESLNAHLTLETIDIDVDIPELTDDGVGPPVTDMSYMGGSDSNVEIHNQLILLDGEIQCGEPILRASDGKPGGALDSDRMAVTSDGFTIEEAGFGLHGTHIEVAFWIDNPPEDSTGGTIEFTIPAGVITDLSGNGNSQFAYTFNFNVRHTTDGAGNNYRVISTYVAENANAAPQVSETLLPEETLLLANYPNPFNPETWIPYHLANDSNVQISIYDINGALVRQLDLGYRQAGYYTNRSRAAYWDGTNDFGERVATGIYFYQLQADNMSLLRKMLILK